MELFKRASRKLIELLNSLPRKSKPPWCLFNSNDCKIRWGCVKYYRFESKALHSLEISRQIIIVKNGGLKVDTTRLKMYLVVKNTLAVQVCSLHCWLQWFSTKISLITCASALGAQRPIFWTLKDFLDSSRKEA